MTDRVAGLQARLQAAGMDAALLMQPRDVFYYAGTGQPCNLWVPAEGEAILFARRAVEWARKDSSLPRVIAASSLREMTAHLPPLCQGAVIGIEQDVLPAAIAERVARTFPGCRLASVSPIVLRQRLVKDEEEIAAIRAAALLWNEVHTAILETLRHGVTEASVAAEISRRLIAAGAGAQCYFRRWDASLPLGGVVAAGDNAWHISGHAFTVTGLGLGRNLPWGWSERAVAAGELVVADFGIHLKGYQADMARTYAVGPIRPEQLDLWERLQELHQVVIAAVRPGIPALHLYEVGLKAAADLGQADWFMGYGESKGRYIGHGLGLEMDEPPVIGPDSEQPLRPGMVITLEPKFIVPGVGAVMVEDDLLITDTGTEILGQVEARLFEP